MWDGFTRAEEHVGWIEGSAGEGAYACAAEAGRRIRDGDRGPRAPGTRAVGAKGAAARGPFLRVPGPVQSSCVLIVSEDHETLGWGLANFERYTRWIPIAACSAQRAAKLAEAIRISALAADAQQLRELAGHLRDAPSLQGVLRILLCGDETKLDGHDADVMLSRAWPNQRVAEAMRLCAFVQHLRRGKRLAHVGAPRREDAGDP